MLADVLKERGMSAYRLAKVSGVSVSSVIKYSTKTDCSKMPIDTAYKLAKALSMSLDELWRSIQN